MSKSNNGQEDNNSSKYDIEIFNLSKYYKIKRGSKIIRALHNANLNVEKGEIFGLLGPNGAGKTTMVSILTTLKQPTSGYARILGKNILKEKWFVKENVGLMFGSEMIYNKLTGYRNLKFFCKLYGIKNYKEKINQLAEKLNLTNWLYEFASKYSSGMKLKLALARVLLIDPKILFLDEPMLGLDPKTVREVIEILKSLGTTIFLTSHQMDIVSRLCDRIAFLKEGQVLKVDTQENFKKMISNRIKIEIELLKDESNFIELLKNLEFVSEVERDSGKIHCYIESVEYYSKLFNFLKNYPVIHINELKPTLEDVFINMVS